MLNNTTLVLGGGGVWGVAWMMGVIAGLEDSGINIRQPKAIIGTSAGAIVGAQLTSSLPTQALVDRQIAPPDEALSLDDHIVSDAGVAAFSLLSKPWPDPEERLRALCEFAINAKTMAWSTLREGIVAASAPFGDQWPSISLTVTAVNVETCSLQPFNAATGANILDAIAASCAVPGFWPPVPIGDQRYIDGGLWRTGENAHLAAGASSILIISPFAYLQSQRSENHSFFEGDVASLRSQGARVTTIGANAKSLSTLGPRGVMDSSTNKAAVEAGRAQGRREAAALQAEFM